MNFVHQEILYYYYHYLHGSIQKFPTNKSLILKLDPAEVHLPFTRERQKSPFLYTFREGYFLGKLSGSVLS